MKDTTLYAILLIMTIILIVSLPKTNDLVIDLPEEINQSLQNDTLYCIRRNDSLIIQFK